MVAMATTHAHSWLVCDAGGTNCSFALVEQTDRTFDVVARARYDSQTITDFAITMAEARKTLLQQSDFRSISGACVSAAGPVHDGTVKLTNTSWSIDERELSQGLETGVRIINDLTAIGYALPLVNLSDGGECVSVWEPASGGFGTRPRRNEASVQAVAAAGTGLGVAIVCEAHPDSLTVLPSEGGHTDLVGFDAETRQFQHFVESAIRNSPDAELYVSGQGLKHAAAFIMADGGFRDGPAQELRTADPADYPALVSRYASDSPDAARAMRLFAKMYGRFVSGLALTVLPYAGLFLAGGVTARNLEAIMSSGFLEGYFSHPHEGMQSALRRVPVYALRNYDVSLIGAAHAAYLSMEA
ncbi:MAG: hypothetical protein EA383_15990 [Spirochaetaceae bacterium]|nr:MAG: hypothetical protein EA383_15990 [Spirochaetaceae bacterium]